MSLVFYSCSPDRRLNNRVIFSESIQIINQLWKNWTNLPSSLVSLDLHSIHTNQPSTKLEKIASLVIIIILLLLFCVFLGPRPRHMEATSLNQSCSCRSTPQPQQHRIWAASVTFTTAHSSARFLTHWVRPRIKPPSSRLLVIAVSAEPWWELPR